MLESTTVTATATGTTPNTVKTPSRISNTSATAEEKSQRRRSTFYVPLVIEDSGSTNDDTCSTDAIITSVSSSTDSSHQQNKHKGLELATKIASKSSLANSNKMTPPCGLNWSMTRNNSNHHECYESDDEMFLAITQQQSQQQQQQQHKKKALKKSHSKKLQQSINDKNKRYGIVLYSNNSDDEMQQNNNKVQHLDVIADNHPVSITADDVTRTANVYEDEDSEISRVQTNTSTPIKMMKSRSRTNILSVPSVAMSSNIEERQAPILMKSKTMPQNLTPGILYEMNDSTSKLSISAYKNNVNASTSALLTTSGAAATAAVVSTGFSPKNLFTSKLSASPKSLRHNKNELSMISTAKNLKNSNADYISQGKEPQQKLASPAKKSLSFIRRAHSTKLSRNNSLLKSQQQKQQQLQQQQQNQNDNNNMLHLLCYSGSWSKDLYVNYEVQALLHNELSMYLRSDHGAHLIRERFNLNINQPTDYSAEQSTSTIDDEQQDDAGHHSGKKHDTERKTRKNFRYRLGFYKKF